MNIIVNFPLFSIIVSFVGVVLCSLFDKKKSMICAYVCNIICIILGAFLIGYTLKHGHINYQMGHFPAPFNNEIRFGPLEALLATFFPIILLLILLGGKRKLDQDVEENKHHYYYLLSNLILVAIIALIYTNDIFTGYVFLEISTLASVGLIMIKEKGRSTIAAIRYLIFNLIGSGLFLLGCILLYDLTGYLSMEYIAIKISELSLNGNSNLAIGITFTLILMGLGIKSGLFPFYMWMPDAYGAATTSSSSIVSGMVSKGYIILLIKFIYRTFGYQNLYNLHLLEILFFLGIAGMIFGSINAIKQTRISKMIAFSSAAQIGYIYLALGLGKFGLLAAIFQIMAHAITKSLLFISSSGLIDVSSQKQGFKYLRGSARRNKLAGFGFIVGSFSMIGFPLCAGFFMKYLYIQAAFNQDISKLHLYFTIVALVISTLLNTAYFIRTCITILSPEKPLVIEDKVEKDYKNNPSFIISIISLIALNISLGCIVKIVEIIEKGIEIF